MVGETMSVKSFYIGWVMSYTPAHTQNTYYTVLLIITYYLVIITSVIIQSNIPNNMMIFVLYTVLCSIMMYRLIATEQLRGKRLILERTRSRAVIDM